MEFFAKTFVLLNIFLHAHASSYCASLRNPSSMVELGCFATVNHAKREAENAKENLCKIDSVACKGFFPMWELKSSLEPGKIDAVDVFNFMKQMIHAGQHLDRELLQSHLSAATAHIHQNQPQQIANGIAEAPQNEMNEWIRKAKAILAQNNPKAMTFLNDLNVLADAANHFLGIFESHDKSAKNFNKLNPQLHQQIHNCRGRFLPDTVWQMKPIFFQRRPMVLNLCSITLKVG